MTSIFISTEFFSAVIGALAGALIGGFFTCLAACYTMKKQGKLDEEQRRVERMPLIRINLESMLPGACDFSILGILDGELLTSANPDAEIVYTFLCVTPDVAAAFNFRVTEVYAKPFGVIKKSSAFVPLPIQLLPGEKERLLFLFLDELNYNIDVAVRFEYEDVFGNAYVQDAIFQYLETEYDDRKRTVLEKREVFQPQLKKTRDGKEWKIKSLKEITDMLNLI